jgi:DNA-binding transcriptional ArsR family regulator
MFNELFGPSIYLLLLDLFLDDPKIMANLREVARMVDKNPGSVSRVLPRLVEKGFVEQIRVGKVMYAYRLNEEDDIVRLLLQFRRRLREESEGAEERGRYVETVNAGK